MVKEAKVAIFEDDSRWQESLESQLKICGHTVVLRATTYPAALEAITEFDKLGVEVAIIDGNLSPYMDSGIEGRNLVRAIRGQAPHVKIVGMSRDNQIFEGLVDINPGKFGLVRTSLGEIVNTL